MKPWMTNPGWKTLFIVSVTVLAACSNGAQHSADTQAGKYADANLV